MLTDRPLVCVDLETTGANPYDDRITEVGIVEIGPDGVREWSSLVDPGCRISPFIEQLTGISNAMVADAPAFADIAAEVMARLEGRLFVAHNARFDYGFLKNEFKRAGLEFRAEVLCTVKLSRRLYPEHHRHSLDALIARHGLETAGERHRALTDARLVQAFLAHIRTDRAPEAMREAVAEILRRPAVPAGIAPEVVDDLPELPGVYSFYGENDLPLYIGKGVNIRKRVLGHFAGTSREAKALKLTEQIRRVDWQATGGELGALLLESRLIKERQPLLNRQLRREADLTAWQVLPGRRSGLTVALRRADEVDFGAGQDLYGLFTSRARAVDALRKLAEAYELCLVQLELEKPGRGADTPCFGYQLKRCGGICVGHEAPQAHDARLLEALSKLRLKAWPYGGPIGIREGDDLHLVANWCYLGTARSEDEVYALLEGAGRPRFDMDTYKALRNHLQRKDVQVVPLGGD